MTDALKAASAIPKLIEFIPELSRKLAQWHLDIALTPTSIDDLLHDIEQALPVFLDARTVIGYGQSTSDAEDPLARILNNAVNKLKRIKSHSEDLRNKNSNIWFRMHPSIIKERLKQLKDELHKTDTLILSLLPSLRPLHASGRQPEYKVVFSVTPNPPNVSLDFHSKDANGTPATLEGELMQKLLSPSSHRTVGAVAAKGMGGVGKTVAMRGVALLPETQRRFPGGIFFVSIGADGGVSDVKKALARMVRRAGGRQKAEDIEVEDDFSQAVDIAAEWFSHSPCLFIFDDVWFNNGIKVWLLEILYGVARHQWSRLAFTSRDKRVVSFCSEAVIFQPRDQNGTESARILLQSAGVGLEPSSMEAKNVYHGILKECNGLPLALSLAGAAVKSFASRVSVIDGRWLAYKEKRSAFNEEIEVGDQRRKNLVDSVKFSLKLVSEDISAEKETSVEDVFLWFKSLSVFQKQRPVPAAVLCRVWNVKQVFAETILNTLDCYSLLQSHFSGTGNIESVAIHDLIMDIARDLCAEGEVARLSRDLLTSYIPKEGRPGGCQEHGLDAVSFKIIEDDGFIGVNMCTLLKQGEMKEVLSGLVADPLWLVNQMHTNGHDQVENDIQLCLECLSGEDLFLECRERELFVSFLRATKLAVARMAKDVVSSSWDGMAWFQLYGRLQSHAVTNKFTYKLLQDVRYEAPRPWVEPSIGCLPSSSSSMAHVIRLQDCVEILCSQRIGNSLYTCHQTRKSLVISSYDWDRTAAEGTHCIELEEIGSSIECACFYDRDGVILGLDDGCIIILRRHTSQASLDLLQKYGRQRRNIANQDQTPKLGSDGMDDSEDLKSRTEPSVSCLSCLFKTITAVPFWTRNSDVREIGEKDRLEEIPADKDAETRFKSRGGKWGLENHDGHAASVEAFPVSRLHAQPMSISAPKDTTQEVCAIGQEPCTDTSRKSTRHGEAPELAARAHDRIPVVSGPHDNTVRVLEEGEERWTLQKLSGHEDTVLSVAVTNDGRRMVSGSHDETVRVWEEGEEGWSSQTLSGHNGEVMSVTVTNDGRRVVSASGRSVQIWEEGEEGWSSQELSWQEGLIWSVAVTNDGRRVASGSDDNAVWIWEKGEGGWSSQTLSGHKRTVKSVAVTNDGRRVVSGSDDDTIRVWEEGEEGWSSQTLSGHDRAVTSVTVTNDGKQVVSGSEDDTVRVWEEGEEGWSSQALSGNEHSVISVAVTNDGRRVVSGSEDGTVRVWEEGEEGWSSQTLSGHACTVWGVGVMNDGRRVVSGSSDRTVRVWEEGEGGWSLQELLRPKYPVFSVAVTNDGRRVVSRFQWRPVLVWDEGEEGWSSQALSGDASGDTNVAMTNDGKRVVTGTYDHTIRVWEEGKGEWRGSTIDVGDGVKRVAFLWSEVIEYTLCSRRVGYLELDCGIWKRKEWSEIGEQHCLARGEFSGKTLTMYHGLPGAVWEELVEKIGVQDWRRTASGFFCVLGRAPYTAQLRVVT